MLLRSEIGGFTCPGIDQPDVVAEVGSLDVSDRLHRCRDDDPELFTKLAHQGVVGDLTYLDVSTGEVPRVRVPASGRVSMTEQELIIATQDRRHDQVLCWILA